MPCSQGDGYGPKGLSRNVQRHDGARLQRRAGVWIFGLDRRRAGSSSTTIGNSEVEMDARAGDCGAETQPRYVFVALMGTFGMSCFV